MNMPKRASVHHLRRASFWAGLSAGHGGAARSWAAMAVTARTRRTAASSLRMGSLRDARSGSTAPAPTLYGRMQGAEAHLWSNMEGYASCVRRRLSEEPGMKARWRLLATAAVLNL